MDQFEQRILIVFKNSNFVESELKKLNYIQTKKKLLNLKKILQTLNDYYSEVSRCFVFIYAFRNRWPKLIQHFWTKIIEHSLSDFDMPNLTLIGN